MFENVENLDYTLLEACLFVLLVSGSPSRVRLCPSCLRRFGDLKTKHDPGFVEHAFCGVVDF